MSTEVEVPEVGESITEVILARWHHPDGARVSVDEPLCELETDKANVDLPAPRAGVLRRRAEEGDTLRIGQVAAVIEEGDASDESGGERDASDEDRDAGDEERDAETEDRDAETEERDAGDEDRDASSRDAEAEDHDTDGDRSDADHLSPAVRRLVEEHDLAPASIEGSGPRGRILKEDVRAHLEEGDGDRPRSGERSGERREPMSKIRRRIAARMVEAGNETAMLTTFNEIDMAALQALRHRHRKRFEEAHGVRLGLMSLFTRATAQALRDFPVVNASVDGDEIVYRDRVDMGLAVSTDRGLVVPVIRGVGSRSLAELEQEIRRVAGAARDGKLSLDELQGGTFTITNGGVFGSMMSTPILNRPQSGILGMHAIQDRPVAVDGEVVIRPMMYVALTYDHRLVDGATSVRFLVRVKELLEDPARMLLEV